MDGVRLYPLLDELGDMIAMSFEYTRKVKNEEVTFFETYTSNIHYKWKQQGNGWELVKLEQVAVEDGFLEFFKNIYCVCENDSFIPGEI